jgi:hypothetical protein
MLLYSFDQMIAPQLLHIYDVTLTGIIAMITALVASMMVNA